MSARVGIVGAGPVGLMLALLLDRYGVAVTLFDADPAGRTHPRGSTLSARTMEILRALGLAGRMRRLGLPADHPTDVRYLTRLDGYELARLALPSEIDKQRAVAAGGELAQEPEPVLRANQMHLERLLAEQVACRAGIEHRPGWTVEAFAQDAHGVEASARHARQGRVAWRFAYLVGCDGARSLVRRLLDIPLTGFDGIGERYFGGAMLAVHFRAPALYALGLAARPAFQYWICHADLRATLITLDGRGEFLAFLREEASGADGAADPERVRELLRRCIGYPAPIEVAGIRSWRAGAALVAERFADRRVFLAGDAAHVFTPTGGFGMNTGIEDAANLAWKLAARLQGWGGRGLLASYEAERHPVAWRNVTAARELSRRVGEVRIGAQVDQDTPAGRAERARLGALLAGFADQFDASGIHLGARYDGSAHVLADGDPPPNPARRYLPSGVPGGRAPHFWMDGGRGAGSSVYDRFGAGFALLRFAGGGGELIDACRRAGVPLAVVDAYGHAARALYGRALVLVRPDGHVGWRGDAVADAAAAAAIVSRLTA